MEKGAVIADTDLPFTIIYDWLMLKKIFEKIF